MRSAVIVAGGNATRYGKDKLAEQLFDKSVLEQTVAVFAGLVDEIVVVGARIDGCKYAPSGSTRGQSVQNGLACVSSGCKYVAIHDGARPFVSRQLVQKLFDQATQHGSAIPSVAVTDTVYNVSNGDTTLADRNNLLAVQTPQVFDFQKILYAYNNTEENYTDESSLYLATYGSVHFVDGQRNNVKVTYAGDLPNFRVGVGYDVHQLVDGSGVKLGGVTIPFNKKLLGHSDADVVAHAIADAVLSASNNKDIGHQFPDTDDKYLGADSIKLLEQCVALAHSCRFEVVNVSVVIICQQPKIAPYIDQMKAILAQALQVDVSCVNITATTTEKLGTIGAGDGIACSCNALLKMV